MLASLPDARHVRGSDEPRISWPLGAAALIALASCTADLPDVTDADGSLSGECTPYADLLLAYTPTPGQEDREVGARALGAPDGQSVPVAANGVLTVAFTGGGGIVDATGDDLVVHGSATGDGEVAVYVGSEPSELHYSGALGPDSLTVDLATASATHVVYVRLIGIAGQTEIDALESVQTECDSPHLVHADRRGPVPAARAVVPNNLW